jgi:DNA-binding winged helix-turn-helix (wHTH) protein/Tol biopolymer transport system component
MTTDRSSPPERMFRFGSFEVSEREGELRKNGVRVKLQEHPFRVLLELVSNAGRLVTREELQQKLWPEDTFVDFDVGVNTAIRKLRQALGDEAGNPRFIETLSRRGYRFVASITETAPAPMINNASPVITETSSSIDTSPAGPLDSLPSAGKERTSPEGGSDSALATAVRKGRGYWLLPAACALALVIYGGVLAWRQANTAPPLVTEQRITANPPQAPITAAAVSPDGKLVAYSDPTGVYIRHIDTGETRALQLPKAFGAVPTGWFPDGTHVLLSSGGEQENPTLWRISILGGGPQKVMDNASGGVVSPDGSKIAFSRGDAAGPVEIWVMGSDGSVLHRIAEANMPEASVAMGYGTASQPFAGVFLSGVAWSPDGRRVAYVRRFEAASPAVKHSLETVNVNGGMPKVLKISMQLLPVVCWAADGRLLYAYRDDPASEREDSGIWAIRVNQKSGEPEGKEVQLTKGAGRIGGLNVTADARRLILWRVNTFPQVFLTEIDAESGHFKTPHRLTLDDNINQAYAWTPDSRAVLFSSNRSGTTKLYRQAIDQAVPEVLVEGRGMFVYRLNPDGTQILYVDGFNAPDPARLQSVMRVPLQGGSPQVVLQRPSIMNIQCARSPSTLCLLNTLEQDAARFFSFDPEDGKTQDFATFKLKEGLSWSLSPDGSQLAVLLRGSGRGVTFMNVFDKSTHSIELNPWPLLNIDWAADGKRVFVSSRNADGAPVILGVEPNGKYRVLLEGDSAGQYWWAVPSPDGRYAALEVVTGENNVWMVENF